ncbi:peptidase family M13, partial [Aureobasidium melanogenum]
MAGNNRNERTPLLDGDAPTTDHAESSESTATRIKRFLLSNGVYLIIILCLLLVLIPLIIQSIRNSSVHHGPHDHKKHHHDKEPSDPPSNETELCTSAACVLASANILRSLAPSYEKLDPCDDFRTYVCAGFDASHEIREDQAGVGNLQIMNEDNQLILKHILESPAPKDTSLFWTAANPDQEIFTKLQDGYNACMNETLLASIGSKPLLDLLWQLDGIYPEKSRSSKKDESLTKAIEYLMEIGVAGPVSVDVGADDKDPDVNVISVGAPWSFGLPSKQYYERAEIITSYKDTIGTVLEALLKEAKPGALSFMSDEGNDPSTLSKDLVDSLVAFEKSMANAAPDPEDAADVTKYYNPRTLKETEAYNSEISITHILNTFAPGYKPSKIIVGSPSYLKDLSKILKSSSRKTIKTYLVWKVVQSWAGAVEDPAVQPLLRFRNKLQGKAPDVKQERWRTCVSSVGSDLEWIMSRFFVERAFSKEAKDLGDQIILDIKDEFTIKLNESEWMTESVRQLAIEKVHLIRQKIGYPTQSPDITNAGELQQYYSNISISGTTYFANKLSVVRHDVRESWSQVGKPVDKDEWGMSAQTVNAYYNPPGNEIVFPAGIMQAPVFYDPSIPRYLSYGAFGAVAGHELSHAFDSSGRNYDQNGNYTDWWDKPTIEAFKTKTDCFVEQYHNYTVPTKNGRLPINGKLTLGENIADAGGLTAAYQSWKRRDDEKADLMLPGLDHFTKEQIFFLAYGQTWCGKMREEQIVQRIYTDPHSPDMFRIKGTTANSREFREAFKCPVKAPTCELCFAPIADVGITEIYCPASNVAPVADIVFVHGLMGHPRDTWLYGKFPKAQPTATHKENVQKRSILQKVFGSNKSAGEKPDLSSRKSDENEKYCFWPYHLLPKDDTICHARILLYGYNSEPTNFYKIATNRMTISQHANDLLHRVTRVRVQDPNRPLIFIAHSLGGIIVKRALIESRDTLRQADQNLLLSCRGIIFMGTPHLGADIASWGEIMSNIVGAIPGAFSTYSGILRGLKPDSEILELTSTGFNRILEQATSGRDRIQICSVQEGLDSLAHPDQVVPDFSSKCHRPDVEQSFFNQSANHMMMCKFSSAEDEAYKDVLGVLHEYFQMIKERQAETQQAQGANDQALASGP